MLKLINQALAERLSEISDLDNEFTILGVHGLQIDQDAAWFEIAMDDLGARPGLVKSVGDLASKPEDMQFTHAPALCRKLFESGAIHMLGGEVWLTSYVSGTKEPGEGIVVEAAED